MFQRKKSMVYTFILITVLSFIFSSQALADLTTIYPAVGPAVGTELILSPEQNPALSETTLQLQLLDAEQVIARRLAKLDLPEPYTVTQQDGQLIVTLPEQVNRPYVNSFLAHIGDVQFLAGGTTAPPIGRHLNLEDKAAYESLFSGQDIEQILAPDAVSGQIFYEIVLKPEAAAQFKDLTGGGAGNHICIAMDHEVISCSAMYAWEDGSLEIMPNLSSNSVVTLADLAIFVDSGPLPLPLTLQ